MSSRVGRRESARPAAWPRQLVDEFSAPSPSKEASPVPELLEEGPRFTHHCNHSAYHSAWPMVGPRSSFVELN